MCKNIDDEMKTFFRIKRYCNRKHPLPVNVQFSSHYLRNEGLKFCHQQKYSNVDSDTESTQKYITPQTSSKFVIQVDNELNGAYEDSEVKEVPFIYRKNDEEPTTPHESSEDLLTCRDSQENEQKDDRSSKAIYITTTYVYNSKTPNAFMPNVDLINSKYEKRFRQNKGVGTISKTKRKKNKEINRTAHPLSSTYPSNFLKKKFKHSDLLLKPTATPNQFNVKDVFKAGWKSFKLSGTRPRISPSCNEVKKEEGLTSFFIPKIEIDRKERYDIKEELMRELTSEEYKTADEDSEEAVINMKKKKDLTTKGEPHKSTNCFWTTTKEKRLCSELETQSTDHSESFRSAIEFPAEDPALFLAHLFSRAEEGSIKISEEEVLFIPLNMKKISKIYKRKKIKPKQKHKSNISQSNIKKVTTYYGNEDVKLNTSVREVLPSTNKTSEAIFKSYRNDILKKDVENDIPATAEFPGEKITRLLCEKGNVSNQIAENNEKEEVIMKHYETCEGKKICPKLKEDLENEPNENESKYEHKISTRIPQLYCEMGRTETECVESNEFEHEENNVHNSNATNHFDTLEKKSENEIGIRNDKTKEITNTDELRSKKEFREIESSENSITEKYEEIDIAEFEKNKMQIQSMEETMTILPEETSSNKCGDKYILQEHQGKDVNINRYEQEITQKTNDEKVNTSRLIVRKLTEKMKNAEEISKTFIIETDFTSKNEENIEGTKEDKTQEELEEEVLQKNDSIMKQISEMRIEALENPIEEKAVYYTNKDVIEDVVDNKDNLIVKQMIEEIMEHVLTLERTIQGGTDFVQISKKDCDLLVKEEIVQDKEEKTHSFGLNRMKENYIKIYDSLMFSKTKDTKEEHGDQNTQTEKVPKNKTMKSTQTEIEVSDINQRVSVMIQSSGQTEEIRKNEKENKIESIECEEIISSSLEGIKQKINLQQDRRRSRIPIRKQQKSKIISHKNDIEGIERGKRNNEKERQRIMRNSKESVKKLKVEKKNDQPIKEVRIIDNELTVKANETKGGIVERKSAGKPTKTIRNSKKLNRSSKDHTFAINEKPNNFGLLESNETPVIIIENTKFEENNELLKECTGKNVLILEKKSSNEQIAELKVEEDENEDNKTEKQKDEVNDNKNYVIAERKFKNYKEKGKNEPNSGILRSGKDLAILSDDVQIKKKGKEKKNYIEDTDQLEKSIFLLNNKGNESKNISVSKNTNVTKSVTDIAHRNDHDIVKMEDLEAMKIFSSIDEIRIPEVGQIHEMNRNEMVSENYRGLCEKHLGRVNSIMKYGTADLSFSENNDKFLCEYQCENKEIINFEEKKSICGFIFNKRKIIEEEENENKAIMNIGEIEISKINQFDISINDQKFFHINGKQIEIITIEESEGRSFESVNTDLNVQTEDDTQKLSNKEKDKSETSIKRIGQEYKYMEKAVESNEIGVNEPDHIISDNFIQKTKNNEAIKMAQNHEFSNDIHKSPNTEEKTVNANSFCTPKKIDNPVRTAAVVENYEIRVDNQKTIRNEIQRTDNSRFEKMQISEEENIDMNKQQKITNENQEQKKSTTIVEIEKKCVSKEKIHLQKYSDTTIVEKKSSNKNEEITTDIAGIQREKRFLGEREKHDKNDDITFPDSVERKWSFEFRYQNEEKCERLGEQNKLKEDHEKTVAASFLKKISGAHHESDNLADRRKTPPYIEEMNNEIKSIIENKKVQAIPTGNSKIGNINPTENISVLTNKNTEDKKSDNDITDNEIIRRNQRSRHKIVPLLPHEQKIEFNSSDIISMNEKFQKEGDILQSNEEEISKKFKKKVDKTNANKTETRKSYNDDKTWNNTNNRLDIKAELKPEIDEQKLLKKTSKKTSSFTAALRLHEKLTHQFVNLNKYTSQKKFRTKIKPTESHPAENNKESNGIKQTFPQPSVGRKKEGVASRTISRIQQIEQMPIFPICKQPAEICGKTEGKIANHKKTGGEKLIQKLFSEIDYKCMSETRREISEFEKKKLESVKVDIHPQKTSFDGITFKSTTQTSSLRKVSCSQIDEVETPQHFGEIKNENWDRSDRQRKNRGNESTNAFTPRKINIRKKISKTETLKERNNRNQCNKQRSTYIVGIIATDSTKENEELQKNLSETLCTKDEGSYVGLQTISFPDKEQQTSPHELKKKDVLNATKKYETEIGKIRSSSIIEKEKHKDQIKTSSTICAKMNNRQTLKAQPLLVDIPEIEVIYNRKNKFSEKCILNNKLFQIQPPSSKRISLPAAPSKLNFTPSTKESNEKKDFEKCANNCKKINMKLSKAHKNGGQQIINERFFEKIIVLGTELQFFPDKDKIEFLASFFRKYRKPLLKKILVIQIRQTRVQFMIRGLFVKNKGKFKSTRKKIDFAKRIQSEKTNEKKLERRNSWQNYWKKCIRTNNRFIKIPPCKKESSACKKRITECVENMEKNKLNKLLKKRIIKSFEIFKLKNSKIKKSQEVDEISKNKPDHNTTNTKETNFNDQANNEDFRNGRDKSERSPEKHSSDSNGTPANSNDIKPSFNTSKSQEVTAARLELKDNEKYQAEILKRHTKTSRNVIQSESFNNTKLSKKLPFKNAMNPENRENPSKKRIEEMTNSTVKNPQCISSIHFCTIPENHGVFQISCPHSSTSKMDLNTEKENSMFVSSDQNIPVFTRSEIDFIKEMKEKFGGFKSKTENRELEQKSQDNHLKIPSCLKKYSENKDCNQQNQNRRVRFDKPVIRQLSFQKVYDGFRSNTGPTSKGFINNRSPLPKPTSNCPTPKVATRLNKVVDKSILPQNRSTHTDENLKKTKRKPTRNATKKKKSLNKSIFSNMEYTQTQKMKPLKKHSVKKSTLMGTKKKCYQVSFLSQIVNFNPTVRLIQENENFGDIQSIKCTTQRVQTGGTSSSFCYPNSQEDCLRNSVIFIRLEMLRKHKLLLRSITDSDCSLRRLLEDKIFFNECGKKEQ